MGDFDKFIKRSKGRKILYASVDGEDGDNPIFDFCEVVVKRSGDGLYSLEDKDGGCLHLNPIVTETFQCTPILGRCGMKGIRWEDTEYNDDGRFINCLFPI